MGTRWMCSDHMAQVQARASQLADQADQDGLGLTSEPEQTNKEGCHSTKARALPSCSLGSRGVGVPMLGRTGIVERNANHGELTAQC